MSSGGFRGNQFEIQEEGEKGGARVVKNAAPVVQEIQDFKLPDIKPGANASYRSSVPAAARASQTTESAKARDKRFQLSQLAREALAITEDEEREIETRVKERLSTEAQQAREAAQKMGYEEGLKKGHDEAYAEFKAASDEKIQAIESILREFDGMKAVLFEANQKFLIDLVYRISRMVMLKELTTDREYLLRLSKELIEKTGLRDNLTIKISADDCATIQELRDGLIQSLGTLRNLNVESSPQVRRGGVILESEWGMIDASIDTQLESVREALK